jgi:hypothetical protein
MNWHQVGSQVVSTLIAGIVAAGPVGLIAKFYLDRSLKRLDARNSERLERMKDELNQRRDSRQALIGVSALAMGKAFEIEFQAINDIDAAFLNLSTNVFMFSSDATWIRQEASERERTVAVAGELAESNRTIFALLTTAKRYIPETLYRAVFDCIKTVSEQNTQVIQIIPPSDTVSEEERQQIQSLMQPCLPLVYLADTAIKQRLQELKRLPD